LQPVTLADDPAKVGAVDIVLFAVKMWDLEQAAQQLKPLIGAQTRVITLQNGVDAEEKLGPILGADHVVPGLTQLATVIAAPGIIRHTSPFALLRFGFSDGRSDPTLNAFVAACQKAGIDAALSENVPRDIWAKFTLLSAMAGLTASTRKPVGPLLADPDTRALFHDIMKEIVMVARAKGVQLPADFADDRLAYADATLPKHMKASMANDLESGNRLELDWLNGRVVELGRALGIPTPANAAVYAVLKPYRMGG
jgi:2-dehydropantoate 2-reductase